MTESLTAIAYKAGFKNLHDLASQVGACLMGSVMSDEFEIIYFLARDEESIELFGVREQSDPRTCALFRIKREYLEKYIGGNGICLPGRGGVNLGKQIPLYRGQTAVDILESYAKQLEELPDSYVWWVERATATNQDQ